MADDTRTIHAGLLTFRRTKEQTGSMHGIWEATPSDPEIDTHWTSVGPEACVLADRVVHLEDALVSKETDLAALRGPDVQIDPEGSELLTSDWQPSVITTTPPPDESGDFRHQSEVQPDPELTPLDELPDEYQYVEWETCEEKSSKIHIVGPNTLEDSTICGQLIGPIPFGVMHSTDRDRVCWQCERSMRKRQREMKEGER